MEWVLDTWLLETAQDPSKGQRALNSLHLLSEILRGHTVGLDHGGQIRREYAKHIHPRSHVEEWWKLLVSKSGKITFRTGRVPSKRRAYLLNTLRFDPSDMIFVGVAFEGPDKLLVSEESDYDHGVVDYLEGEMGVHVLDIESALVRTR